ncbi:MAG UNVERIFIED_CONTAM: hypothetical protein LVQ98_08945 [Rickettsiaceae bacterium]|jgi:hypothetical protein
MRLFKIPGSLIASTYETASELSEAARVYNAKFLQNVGMKIIYGLDGSKTT